MPDALTPRGLMGWMVHASRETSRGFRSCCCRRLMSRWVIIFSFSPLRGGGQPLDVVNFCLGVSTVIATELRIRKQWSRMPKDCNNGRTATVTTPLTRRMQQRPP